MRGPERVVVGGLLAGAAAATGALAGFASGVALSWFNGRVPLVAMVAAVAATVVLDVAVAPPSVRRQVPQLWGRLFSPRATAVLYGARLGVGPLTILRTWWWWLAFVLGALGGVWPAVATGVTFGVARVVAMVAAGPRVSRMPSHERSVVVASVAAAAVMIAAVAAVGIGRDAAAETSRAEVACADACIRDGSAGTSTVGLPADVSTPAAAALGAALPPDLGPGFTRVPDEQGRALGALDLDRAASAERDSPAERALLETRHFESGHARAWRRDDGVLAYAAAYRFRSAADARAYLTDGFITLEGRGARSHALDDPVGARAFSQASSHVDGGEVAHGVAFVRDDVFFLVFASARTSAVTADDAQLLARLVDGWHRGAH